MNLIKLDRRFIYLLVLISLLVPLLFRLALAPAPMKSAKLFFNLVDALEPAPGKFVILFLDFGPGSKAETFPQSEVVMEHLMRKRIPFALLSQYLQAEPLLETIPQSVADRLNKENSDHTFEYGKDWVNLGYRIGGSIFMQGFARSDNIVQFLGKDARGNDLTQFPMFKGVTTIKSVQLLNQFTGLTGTLEVLLQFFQRTDYRPPFGHGCTSITVPQAFIFLDSGQIKGLLEGIAGAASYSTLLQEKYPDREPDRSRVLMTGLGVAHLVVIALVIFGNIVFLVSRRKGV